MGGEEVGVLLAEEGIFGVEECEWIVGIGNVYRRRRGVTGSLA